MSAPEVVVIVCARDEEARLGATLAALAAALPGARVVVADDGSRDGTAAVARAAGAELVRTGRRLGKGGAATRAAWAVLPAVERPEPPVVVLCDADLGPSAAQLAVLVAAVRAGTADLVVAAFAQRAGGGFGLAVGSARRVLRAVTGLELRAPLSGQRALRGEVLAAVVPFAPRFGLEVGMTIDAVRAGFTVAEVELDLEHRATGRDARGFAHRARQLADLALAALDRR